MMNVTSIKTSSNGLWQGDNPLHFAFPLLILQTILILTFSRLLALIFKPLRQPKVIAEMLGGILLGPSLFGRNQDFMQWVFPKWSTPILESVAGIGLLFFLFLVGLELDLNSIRRTGWRAFTIAVAGISFTFTLGVGVAFVFRKSVAGADAVGFPEYLVFMGVALSITAFPVLARVLAELKLLTTHLGETAMAAAALNDVAAWISLALAVALAGNGGDGPKKSPLISIWVLLSGVVFVGFMMIVIKPAMNWVERQCSPLRNTGGDEAYICLALGGVLAAGFVTDLIGIHSIFGAFIFGLTIPKEGELGRRLMERIEDFVWGLLLPLYFASSGLKTDVSKINGGEAWGLLVLVIAVACAGKVIGTFAAAMVCRIPARESITLGVLMNTKGLVELIVLNIGKEKKVLNDEVFTILVLMALFTTFLTTPVVMAIYQHGRGVTAKSVSERSLQSVTSDEIRILGCVHGPANIPSLLKFIELTRSANKLKLYAMHLVQLTERSSSILMAQRWRKNGSPLISCLRPGGHLPDPITLAIQLNSELSRVSIRPVTAISALSTMHEDIRHVAEEKAVSMIVLPFHKQWRKIEGEEVIESIGHEWSQVNQRVLKEAPCTVAVLVDRGYGNDSTLRVVRNVCVLYFGGPDDREALELGGRMVGNPAVKVSIIRFIQTHGTVYDKENGAALAEFMSRSEGKVELIEKIVSSILDEVSVVGKSSDYNLIVVGKGWPCSSAAVVVEHPELGPIGNLLAQGTRTSLVVVQSHGGGHQQQAILV